MTRPDLKEAEPFLERGQSQNLSLRRNYLRFVETKGSLPCLEAPPTGPYRETQYSSRLYNVFVEDRFQYYYRENVHLCQEISFVWAFPFNMCAFLISSHPIPSVSLCPWFDRPCLIWWTVQVITFHRYVVVIISVLLFCLFLNVLGLSLSLNVWNRISHPQKRAGKL